MSGWTETIYAAFPDEATARAMAEQLGAEFPADGSIPTGNENYALHAPITEWVRRPTYDAEGTLTDPGEKQPGYWAMLRFNTDWPGAAQAMATLQAAGVLRTLDQPSNVFA